ncbi:hypothetical protein PENSTE_c001G01520 [Penicillium steckii]|uniref:Uncharacterized protein n=1 Tax=Penicillium steckii TaxID=303698 RepID=A0A1V6U2J5_9EURO|nr:hypothetical protein PENSTE_c001G01520 [Penicillium steckii]
MSVVLGSLHLRWNPPIPGTAALELSPMPGVLIRFAVSALNTSGFSTHCDPGWAAVGAGRKSRLRLLRQFPTAARRTWVAPDHVRGTAPRKRRYYGNSIRVAPYREASLSLSVDTKFYDSVDCVSRLAKIQGLHGATLDLTPGSLPKIWLPCGSLDMALDHRSIFLICRLVGLYTSTRMLPLVARPALSSQTLIHLDLQHTLYHREKSSLQTLRDETK